MAELDPATIRHALSVAKSHGFGEVELEAGTSSFAAKLGAYSLNGAVHQPASDAETTQIKAVPISASCVGFYQPTDSALSIGRHVDKGEIVASIAALGLKNDVESPISGEIVEVLVKPDQAVEFGQALALVKAVE
jgi:acetyl-CoA carboxylase biotin carboxyl carrier protein